MCRLFDVTAFSDGSVVVIANFTYTIVAAAHWMYFGKAWAYDQAVFNECLIFFLTVVMKKYLH